MIMLLILISRRIYAMSLNYHDLEDEANRNLWGKRAFIDPNVV